MPWDPNQYLKFKEERAKPFADLLALVEKREGISAVDLGCGTGELTARLASLLPGGSVVGVDSSPQMLERAQGGEALSFQRGNLAVVEGEWDLIFSNAALHWVDDHPALVRRLFGSLRPGGQLAVQVPSNHRHPSHALLVETAAEEPFSAALDGWTRHSPVLEIDGYGQVLFDCGAERINVFEKVYLHPMENSDGIDQWTAGTTMVPYLERLPEDLHQPFRDRYRAKLREVFPDSPVLYTFRRTFLSCFRSAA